MQDTQVKDAVDQVRSATQQLHKALSDAAAKRTGARAWRAQNSGEVVSSPVAQSPVTAET